MDKTHCGALFIDDDFGIFSVEYLEGVRECIEE